MNIYIYSNKQKNSWIAVSPNGIKNKQLEIKSLSLTTKLTSKLKKQHTRIRTGISSVKYSVWCTELTLYEF